MSSTPAWVGAVIVGDGDGSGGATAPTFAKAAADGDGGHGAVGLVAIGAAALAGTVRSGW